MAEFTPKPTTEILLNEQFRKFLDYAHSLHTLKGVSSEHYHRLVERTLLILDYSGLEKHDDSENRYIFSENILVVLPPNPKDNEQEIGAWIVRESGPRVSAYVNRFGLGQGMALPVIMYRSDDEVAKIVKNPAWSGVISLSYAPLFTTFNCQGMAYAVEKLGKDLGTGATRFSF